MRELAPRDFEPQTRVHLIVVQNDDDEEEEPEKHRNVRKRAVRPYTIKIRKVSQEERAKLRKEFPEAELPIKRPKTRADCADVPRPCPYVGCQHHLYLDVNASTGNIRLNFPDLEPWEMPEHESCSRDVAERERGATLTRVADLLNLTRERARQLEDALLKKLAVPAQRLRR